MSNQSPTASGKDQFPHTDVANNEEAGTPSERDARDRKPSKGQSTQNDAQSHRTPGSAEGERDRDEQSR